MASTSHERPLGEGLHELEEVAENGESPRPPLILLGGAWIVSAVCVLVLPAIAELAYRLAR